MMDEAAVSCYFDEEDCLAFKIFVAELELIVGSSRGKKKADVGQCYQLLQKLVITLERTDRTEVREYQRRCEDALIDILLKGAPPPVRRLICEALGKMYAQGDQLPLFSRVSSLQLFLGTKEASGKETSEDIRLGALELMTSLYYSQGRSLSIGVQETVALAVKYCAKTMSDRTRRAALRLLASAIEGVGSGHRDALAVQQDALKALERLLKEKELGEHVKLGTADVLRAIAAAGGGQLWASSLAGYDFARNACFAGIQDPSPSVRAAYARALGELVNASTSLAAKQSIELAGTKPKYRQAQEKALSAVPDQCLGIPFAECAVASDRKACTALSQAWVWHLIQARLSCGMDEAMFIEPALKPLQSLAAACIQANGAQEKGYCGGDGELGSGVSGGERPHAQACILYVLRVGVIEQLGEVGQRLLLQKVIAMLNASADITTTSTTGGGSGNNNTSDSTDGDTATINTTSSSPSVTSFAAAVDIVLLEITALLIETLGEIETDVVNALEHPVSSKLIGPHAAVRIQAASTLAALAVGNPTTAARLMSSALKNVRDAADALVEEAAAGPDRSRPAAAGTPRGPGSNRFKSEMNHLHGWALGAGALVAATPRLSLGLPSHYMKVAMQLAGALVEAPRTKFAAATCLERESGYILLGSLCHAGVYEMYDGDGVDGNGVWQLWMPAFGKDAMKSLEECLKSRESYAEYSLASELWWRTMALQSLYVYIQHCISSSPSSFQQTANTIVTTIVRPLLSLVMKHIVLKTPSLGRSGPSSSLAGASAMMQLRLLQVYVLLSPWLNGIQQNSSGGGSSNVDKNDNTAVESTTSTSSSTTPEIEAVATTTTTNTTDSNTTNTNDTTTTNDSKLLSDIDMLCTLCMENIQLAATTAGTSSSFDIFTTALHAAFDDADDHLGPWSAGADPLEKALLRFQGAAGGPLPSAWEAGLRYGIGYAVDNTPSSSVSSSISMMSSSGGSGANMHVTGGISDITSTSNHSGSSGLQMNIYQHSGLYPQCYALAPLLFSVQCQVLGIVLRIAPAAVQIAALDGLLTLAQSIPATRKDKDASKRTAALLAAAAPVIMGYSKHATAAATSAGGGVSGSNNSSVALLLSSIPLPCSPKLSQQVKLLAEELIIESKYSNISIQRAAAELFAASATLGGDTLALHLVRELCQRAAETPSLSQRASFALAVGMVNRIIGGLSLSSVLPVVSQTLTALAMASSMAIVPWILHALMSCALAAGLSFVLHVKDTLSLAHNILLNEDIYFVPGLLPAVGRLTNTMVATLGPEYILGSAAYDSCRSVVAELRAPDASGVRKPEDMLSASLESVLYAQMLVLFAPRALPSSQHVRVLIATLPSRQPQLRKAAADTLRHLAERDPRGVLAEHVEPALLAALDGETDPSTARQIQATLQTLLQYGAASQPSRWISLCGEVVSAAAAAAGTTGGGSGNSNSGNNGDGMSGGNNRDGVSRTADEDDDDDDGYNWSTPQKNNTNNNNNTNTTRTTTTASPSSTHIPPPPSPSTIAASRHNTSVTPRLRTRLFAAKCLLQVPALACPTDDRHTDLIAAQRDVQGGDWLVLRVQHLVDIGFKMSTGQLDALRSFGVELMRLVLLYLGSTIDPLSETGDKLLVQYQAQYVSTLRASLVTTATPSVFAAGASLAATFLEKGLAGDDAVVLDRLLQLLCAPLGQWTSGGQDPTQATYAEWVSALTRVAMLESHAHCAVLVSKKGDDTTSGIVLRAQGPFFTLLVECWIGLLHDYAVLRTHERDLINAHQLRMYGKTAARAPKLSLVGRKLAPSMNKAWPTVLAAAASTLMHDRTAAYGTAGKARHESLMDLALSAVYWSQHNNNSNSSNNSNMNGTNTITTATLHIDECLLSSLHALHVLTSSRFIKEGWLSSQCITEILSILDTILSVLPASTPINELLSSNNDDGGDDGRSFFLLSSSSTTKDVVEKCAMIVDQLSIASITATTHDTTMTTTTTTTNANSVVVGENSTVTTVVHIARSCVSHSGSSTRAIKHALSALHHILDTIYTTTTTTTITSTTSSVSAYQQVYNSVLYHSLSSALEITSKRTSTAEQLNMATEHIALTTKHAARLSCTEEILTFAAATAVEGVSKSDERDGLCVAANVSSVLVLGAVALYNSNDNSNGNDSSGNDSNTNANTNTTNDDDGWADAEFTTASTPSQSSSLVSPMTMITTPTQYACLSSLSQLFSTTTTTNTITTTHALSLAAVVSYLQQHHPPPQWATECIRITLPPALFTVHNLLQRGTEIQKESEIQFVLESLKLAVVACSFGDALGKSSMNLSIPILVESAAPPGESTPIIAETAVKLLTAIASGQRAVEFKSVVASLPEESRRRLQMALATVAGSSAASGGVSRGGVNRSDVGSKQPKIQLKMFGSSGFTRSSSSS